MGCAASAPFAAKIKSKSRRMAELSAMALQCGTAAVSKEDSAKAFGRESAGLRRAFWALPACAALIASLGPAFFWASILFCAACLGVAGRNPLWVIVSGQLDKKAPLEETLDFLGRMGIKTPYEERLAEQRKAECKQIEMAMEPPRSPRQSSKRL